jgi:hypothetical protein
MSTKTEIYKKTFAKEDWPGLLAIQKKETELYGDQKPIHWATVVPYEFGGEDPLWAVDCFSNNSQQKHYHYISLGFTNLYYDESLAEDEINGFGFELTFRHLPFSEDTDKPVWAVNMIQNLAKYVFKTKNVFDDYHIIPAGGPIRLETKTEITAIIFFLDQEMKQIDSPHGKIKFIQLFGVTSQEYNDIVAGKYSRQDLIQKHREINPLLITDLCRK